MKDDFAGNTDNPSSIGKVSQSLDSLKIDKKKSSSQFDEEALLGLSPSAITPKPENYPQFIETPQFTSKIDDKKMNEIQRPQTIISPQKEGSKRGFQEAQQISSAEFGSNGAFVVKKQKIRDRE